MDPSKQISLEMLFQILYKNFPYALERLDLLASMIVLPNTANTHEDSAVVKEAAVAPTSPAHTNTAGMIVDKRSDVAGISNVQTRTDTSNLNKKTKISRPIYLKTVKWKPEFTPKINNTLPPKRVTSLRELFLAVRALQIPTSNNTPTTPPVVQSPNIYHENEVSTANNSTRIQTSYCSTEASQELNNSESNSQTKEANAIRSMGYSLMELFDFFKSFDINELRILNDKLKGSPEERVQGVIDHINVIDNINNYEFPTKADAEPTH